jgi:molybdopterin-guanine dinucleotide biosynthesis protein A
MGRDKATMPARNRALITYTYDVVKKIFAEVMVVSNYHESLEGVNARIVRDVVPAAGSMTGIVSALLHASTPYIFILGCDMPLLKEEPIRYMIGQIQGEDIIIPSTSKGFEPMHAIYNRSCISRMLTAITYGRMKLQDLFPFLSVKYVKENELFLNKGVSVFTNVNTEEDLARAEELI